MNRAVAGNASGHYLGALGNERLQEAGVFKINNVHLVAAQSANFATQLLPPKTAIAAAVAAQRARIRFKSFQLILVIVCLVIVDCHNLIIGEW